MDIGGLLALRMRRPLEQARDVGDDRRTRADGDRFATDVAGLRTRRERRRRAGGGRRREIPQEFLPVHGTSGGVRNAAMTTGSTTTTAPFPAAAMIGFLFSSTPTMFSLRG